MIAALHPLYAVRNLLQAIAREEDAERLAECLAGEHLPALGGAQHPAEMLQGALSLAPFDPDLVRRLVRPTARLCQRQAQALAVSLYAEKRLVVGVMTEVVPGGAVGDFLEDEPYVFNLCLFASYLPQDPELFESLTEFHKVGFELEVVLEGTGRVGRQLRRALIYQQSDGRLEEHWFGLLQRSLEDGVRLTLERKNDLLDAWAGLLWIPPPTLVLENNETISIDRVARGLEALHTAVEGTADTLSLLRYAVRQLNETYPRSPEFWAERLGSYFERWPSLLRDVTAERWPALEGEKIDLEGHLPSKTLTVWRALSTEERNQIEAAVAAGEPHSWRVLWERLLFIAPRAGIRPQVWRSALVGIRKALGQNFPTVLGKIAKRSLEELAKSELEAEARALKRRRESRLMAAERVTRELAEISEQLDRGQVEIARWFLEALLGSQRAGGTPPELIARILCKAATSVLAAGHMDWASDLYRQAIAQAPEDVVAHNGLAEVLKTQNRLGEAEELYRQTIALFPNNVIAVNGLAEVLKAQDRLGEAEELYRQTIQLFPNSVVAHTGLAEVLKAQDRYGESEQLYRQTIARWPSNVVAHTGLAEVLKAQDRYGESEQLYRETIARWPSDRVARHGLANVLRKQQRFAEALTVVPPPATLRGRQDHYDLNLRGMLLLESGEIENAIALFEHAISASQAQTFKTPFYSALAVARLRQCRYADALADLERLPDQTPEARVLRFHASAGTGAETNARELHAELSAKILTFRRPVREAVQAISAAWGLDRPGKLREPTDAQVETVIEAEIEMLLAA